MCHAAIPVYVSAVTTQTATIAWSPSDAPTSARAALRRYWGFDSFRPGQEELVTAILQGRPVLGVMPTGGGKSLCYQLPATLLPGVALIVSPLIALMKDQVDQLRQRGIPAAMLNSTLGLDEQMRILEDARSGQLKLLYVAPERFRYEGAMARLRRLPISLFAVDEAHCISHWGHDFRPEYKSLGQAYKDLAPPRLGAFTATATHEVRKDIVETLGMSDPLVTVAGFARDNLHLSVIAIEKMAEKPRIATRLIKSALAEGGVAIVYCATRKHTEEAAELLGKKTGLRVLTYHGGLEDAQRKASQEAFQTGDGLVIVATNAFGMGVDKPNVRLVIHWDFPSSLDAFYQEVGRAGRDGRRAYGVMLFTYADQRIHEFLIDKGGEDLDPRQRAARAEAERHKLKLITRWAYHEGCRHAALLRYFGDRPKTCDLDDPNASRCDRCAGSTGLGDVSAKDGKDGKDKREGRVRDAGDPEREPTFERRSLSEPEEVIVQKALSAVARAGGRVELKTLARVLRGSRAADVLKGPLAGTKSFGILSEVPENTTYYLLKALRAAGCLTGAKPTLTELGVEVMWRRQSVKLGMPPFASATRSGGASAGGRKKADPADAKGTEPGPAAEVDEALLRSLKERRMAVARERGVAAFLVASNALLERIATLPPNASVEAWLALSGVGEKNVEPLREAFQAVLAGHEA